MEPTTESRHASRISSDVIRTVGKPGAVAYSDLVRYPLSLPGVRWRLSERGRSIARSRKTTSWCESGRGGEGHAFGNRALRIEKESKDRHGAGTNYFQEMKPNILVQPSQVTNEADGIE